MQQLQKQIISMTGSFDCCFDELLPVKHIEINNDNDHDIDVGLMKKTTSL